MDVPVVRIRPVDVRMRQFLVGVLMRMSAFNRRLVFMVMVQVVMAVGMRVGNDRVQVRVDVPLVKDETDTGGHKNKSR